jgi:hypothetical protein
MTTSKVDKRNILRYVSEGLRELGFEERGPQVLTKALDVTTLGWIGLSTATYADCGFVDISPFVGVQNKVVERMIGDWLREDRDLIATVSTDIGRLEGAGTFRQFRFSDLKAEDADSRGRILAAVGAVGIPFMKRHTELASIAETLGDGGKINEDIAVRLPVIRRLLGQEAAALAIIERWEGMLGPRQDAAAQRYRRFAAAFRASVQ